MDPFQIRLECLQLVRRLTASQQSILKVVDFAIRYANVAAEDIWDCLVTECAKASLNSRLNIIFLLDALLVSIVDPIGYSSTFSESSDEKEAGKGSTSASSTAASKYLVMAIRDLSKLVDAVVPQADAAAVRLNAGSVQKVLQSWRRLGIFDPSEVDDRLASLATLRKGLPAAHASSTTSSRFSTADVLRRIEEDRERHKRLRERAWILPAKSFADSVPQRSAVPRKGAALRMTSTKANMTGRPSESDGGLPDALDVEFGDAWESISDLNEDDYEHMRESDQKWWGSASFVRVTSKAESIVVDQRPSERSLKRDLAMDPESTSHKRLKEHGSPRRNGSANSNLWRRIGRDDRTAVSGNEQHYRNNQDRRSHASESSRHPIDRHR